ncbi:MAG: WYL domain-containing protein [Acidimicrobiales bacterium]
MNRTDRLYALVEELRAAAPGSRSARELAAIFDVSTRTIERDILALQESGVPIHATPGRRGGYGIDPTRTLPPINFTAAEAVAVAVALAGAGGPFAAAGRRARNKVLAAMSEEDADAARSLAQRVRLMSRWDPDRRRPDVLGGLQDAIADHRVVALDYEDRNGARTRREVEPIAVVGIDDDWYLMAWCRLRDDNRMFRLDRARSATVSDERAPERDPGEVTAWFEDFLARGPQVLG